MAPKVLGPLHTKSWITDPLRVNSRVLQETSNSPVISSGVVNARRADIGINSDEEQIRRNVASIGLIRSQ